MGLAILVSVAVLVVLGWKTGVRMDALVEQFRRVNWAVLAATLAFSVSWHALVGTDKWWRILRGQGADVGYWEVFRVRMGSGPIRFATPFKVGEVVNALYFARLNSFGFSRAAGSIVFDKAINFFGLLFWMYVGLAVMATTPRIEHLAIHVAVGATVLVFFAVRPVRRAAMIVAGKIHPKLGRLAAGVLSAFEEFSTAKKIGFLLYGIVFQFRDLVVCWLLFLAFHPDRFPSVEEVMVYGSLVILMGSVPLTVSGIGPRETALVLLFSGHASNATLLSIGLMMSLSIHVAPAIVGIPWMLPLLRAVTRRDDGTAD
jgi:uncharacterized protein (TIRG00374 family)